METHLGAGSVILYLAEAGAVGRECEDECWESGVMSSHVIGLTPHRSKVKWLGSM